ncbi:MAG: PGPGW domain-containing protein [Halioglobus sp.]
MEFLAHWQQPLLWASGLSLVAAVASIIGIPWVITRLPRDYFARDERIPWNPAPNHPELRLLFAILKNLLGLILVVLGVIMLVTPGQGMLTLLIGLLLMNFPGKYHFEQWLISRPGVMRGMNWLRHRRGKLPFDAPPVHTADD